MKIITILLFVSFTAMLTAQQNVDINQSLQLSAEYLDNNRLLINWLPKDDATGYSISTRHWPSAAFSIPQNIIDSSATSFIIEDLPTGTDRLEVRVLKLGGTQSSGYIMAGDKFTPAYDGKKVVILVEESIREAITSELDLYINTLELELWEVDLIEISASESVTDVKLKIIDRYNLEAFQQLIMLGHIPVPYSGNNAIDGHTSGNNHRGAWVCDAYYGNFSNGWTDTSVNNEEATRDANKNIPGDGKFDQNQIPSLMELAVGRIDFSNLPAFEDDEVELTKKYLLKNIAYRTGNVKATRRGLVDNNFGLGEGFGQGAIKSFSTFFPIDSIHYGQYSSLKTKDYLWSFGAGGGNYKSASGIINTSQLATDSIQSVFTTLFGSYFGDWDIADNLLRSSIASGTTLTNAWSGRPVWQFHQLAMGATFGDVTLAVQNNFSDYFSQFGKRLTHISLIGDPTLKMYYNKPASNFTALQEGNQVTFSWSPSQDVVNGYNIYESINSGSYSKVNEELITENNFEVECPSEGEHIKYVIRPVVLEKSPSGSYFNEGAGVSQTVNISLPNIEAGFAFTSSGSREVLFENTSSGATNFFWSFGDDNFSEEENPTHTYLADGTYTVTLIAGNACKTDTVEQVYTVNSVAVNDIKISYSIYPNPTTSHIFIKGPINNTSYQISNPLGQNLMTGTLSMDKSSINLIKLNDGLYYITIDKSTYIISKESN